MACDNMQKSMHHYENMRDSGIEWIGEVPSHWKTTRMKAIFRAKSVKNHPNAEVLSLYRDFGVLPKSSRDDNHNVTSEDTSQYKYVEKGNLVINKMKAWQGSLAISKYEGIVSPAYYVCEFRNAAVDKNYIHHLLRCVAYAQEFERLSTGMRIGQWDLGIDDFMLVPVILPPLNEQKHIGHYLDAQCLKIDTIISDAKTSIEEYKAWKTSIIYEAVTKGLNPNVEMKDSGIEWIGKIPVAWSVCALKRLTVKIGSGKTPLGGAETYISQGVLFLRSQNIYDTGLRLDNASYISPEVNESMGNTQVKCGDVLLNITGGSIGRCCVYDLNGVAANVNQHVCIIRTQYEVLRPQYLRYFWNSAAGPMIISHYQTGGNRPGLNFEQIGSVKIPLCDVAVQDSIVKYLDKKTRKIDKLIQEKQDLIADLESYKKSLIYEVVTGKRKVV